MTEERTTTPPPPQPATPKEKTAAGLALLAGVVALGYSLLTGEELHTCPPCDCEVVNVVAPVNPEVPAPELPDTTPAPNKDPSEAPAE
jgi:hypothetical protein